MLGLWDEKRKVSAAAVDLTRFQKHLILARIALHLQLSGIDQLDEQPMAEFIGKVLSENGIASTAADVLTVMTERTGLLIGPGIYSFVHKSVSEFLVAQTVFQGHLQDETGEHIDRMRLFRDRINDRWNTVLFFWAGLTTLADLRNFIDRTFDVPGIEDWLLSFGLLHDQLERLPKEWATRTLVRLLENSPPETDFVQRFGTTSSLWCFPPNPFDNRELLMVRSPIVRGLSDASFSETLSALLKATGLGIQNMSKVSNWIFKTLWLHLVTHSEDRNAYCGALSIWPETRPPSLYPFFALNWISNLIDEGAGQQEVIDVASDFEAAFPKLAGVFPFFVLQTCCERLYRASPLSATLWIRATGILRGARVNKEWLKASCKMAYVTNSPLDKKWLGEQRKRQLKVNQMPYEPNPPLDLLVWFGEALDRKILKGDVSDDEYARAARDYVSDLIAERTGLLSKT